MYINTEGIVLRQTKFQESDKILTIFSRTNGKIQAIAKGARRPKSSLISSTQVFCHSEFVMYKGRNMYSINQGEVLSSFYSLREDLNKLAYATYIIELIDAAITEEESNDTLFRLLQKTLNILSKYNEDYSKLVRAFEIKYISLIGYKPNLKSCVMCGRNPEGNLRFSIANGGLICGQCSVNQRGTENIDIETLKIMNLLLYSELDKLEEMKIDPRILSKIKRILIQYIKAHIDKHNFKSLDFLDSIEK